MHALIGENGAGKSTLMKILYGVQKPDDGTLTVNGQQVTFSSPTDAIAHGIGMVFQHFMLADNLTVLENVVLGAEKLHGIGDKARNRVREISKAFGFGLDPDVLVERLGVGDRQRVEILKVLYRGAKIIILDEPTAVLVPQEVDALFANLRLLKAEGHTILFISHKLDEVLDIADDITVMRRGTTVGEAKPGDITKRQLAELMVGSELPSPETEESTVTDEVLLQLDGVTLVDEFGRNLLTDVSFDIHRGEVLGLAGVEGNGQAELVETIMGMRKGADRTDQPRRQGHDAAGTRANAARPASATSPRTGSATACCWTPRCGRTGSSATRPVRRRCADTLIDRSGCARGHPSHRRGVRRPDARHRHHVACAVRRQPAEADRRTRDERRPGPAHRRPIRPAASTWARRPRSGATSRRHAGKAWRCC